MDHDRRFGDRTPKDRPWGGKPAETLIGAVLGDLFEVVPNMRSVTVYRDGERQNGIRCVADVERREADPGHGLPVTPALLGLANWQDGASPKGPGAVIVRDGHMYQLMLPIRGGHLSLVFETHAYAAAQVQRVVDVLNRHGLDTLWLVL
jgi:hypothetical protein